MATPNGSEGAVDVVVMGVPYDGGASFRPGARFGPRAIREASCLLSASAVDGRGDLLASIAVADGGDIDVSPYSHDGMQKRVADAVASVASSGALPLVIGGDHSISLPLLRAVAEVHGPLSLIHFDAHSDTSPPTDDGFEHHGTPFRTAIEERIVNPEQMIQVGLRGTCRQMADLDWVRQRGVSLISMGDFTELGPVRIAEKVREAVGENPVHVSFDIDVIDPAFAPGTGTPVPGGMTSREALQVISSLAPLRVVSADLVEVCPAYDMSDITSVAAASILYEMLWLMASVGGAKSPAP